MNSWITENVWLIPATPIAVAILILAIGKSARMTSAIFAIAIAAAEAAVGLALVIAVYRHFRSTNVDELNQLKG